MTNKLNPNPFDQIGKFWDKLHENYNNWHDAAEEYWKAYTQWLNDVFMHQDKYKK